MGPDTTALSAPMPQERVPSASSTTAKMPKMPRNEEILFSSWRFIVTAGRFVFSGIMVCKHADGRTDISRYHPELRCAASTRRRR